MRNARTPVVASGVLRRESAADWDGWAEEERGRSERGGCYPLLAVVGELHRRSVVGSGEADYFGSCGCLVDDDECLGQARGSSRRTEELGRPRAAVNEGVMVVSAVRMNAPCPMAMVSIRSAVGEVGRD